jgi:hypothetical protein
MENVAICDELLLESALVKAYGITNVQFSTSSSAGSQNKVVLEYSSLLFLA